MARRRADDDLRLVRRRRALRGDDAADDAAGARRASGSRLRVGLHVGEALRDEGDYVGTPVVLARRLCDRATAGQILCSGLVVELLRRPAGVPLRRASGRSS